ncbi:MAG TPA: retropepsin-like aspartic protease [Chthoniobacterales bacterium]|nr:retropepsin-like aspartic protease [Chthoniobacterales bacterium]
MSGRRFLRLLWFSCLLLATHLANAQQNYGQVQGRIAEGFKEVAVTGRVGLQKVKNGFLNIIMPLSVNGSGSTWWIVDTGAPVCLIDKPFAERLGLQKVGQVSGEGGSFPVRTVNNIQFGNFRCDSIPCVVRSIAELRSLGLRNEGGSSEKTGLIGVNLLAKYGALINCRTQQMFLSPTGNLGVSRQKYEAMGFTYVPLNLTSRNRLEVAGNLGGKEFSFFLDTGALSTTFTNGIRDEINVPVYATRSKAIGPFHDFGNSSQVSYGEASDFKLGAYDASGARVNFTTLNIQEEIGSSHRFAGFIGLDFLFYRSAIIDIGGRALYLKPSSAPH